MVSTATICHGRPRRMLCSGARCGMLSFDCWQMTHCVHGKNLEGEIFGEFGEWCTIRQIFSTQIYSEITEDLPADSPKFSSPLASSVLIRQNFLPPKFSHVRYFAISLAKIILA